MPERTINLIIPTLNERQNLPLLLQSLAKQALPLRFRLQILIVDNGSDDGTLEVAAAHGVTVVHNPVRHPEVSKMVGYRQTAGEFFMYLDADIHLNDEHFFSRLLTPLLEDENVVGAFPRFGEHPANSPVERFLNLHPLQLDPLMQVLCTPIEATIEHRSENYSICRFDGTRVPPVGICLYRRSGLEAIIRETDDRFMDIDVPALLGRAGLQRFAFVPLAVIFHESSSSVGAHARKHVRNIGLNMVEKDTIRPRAFVYLRPGDFRQRIRLAFWFLSAITFVPQLFFSFARMGMTGRWEYIYQAPMAFGVSLGVLRTFLATGNGRRALLSMISGAAGDRAEADHTAHNRLP